MSVRFTRGMSLVDVVVGTALLLVLFLALFGLLRASLILSTLGKAKAGATSLASTQMEYLRGLSYDALGTVGGIPSGTVPQDATTTENGIPYAVHTFIQYVDDPADGTGVNDTNGITTDYKRARVSVSYTVGGRTTAVVLVSNFAPPGLETTNGGGTLVINVVNASGAPVQGASVQILNAATVPTVNVTTFTNAAGMVSLPGAATSTSYQVLVSRSGFSSAQTYARDTTNQNPNPGYLTVVKSQTTTQTFAIDALASLAISTFSPITTSTFTDTFADSTKLLTMSSTTVSGGALVLTSGAVAGSALSVATTSSRLVSWKALDATTTVSSGAALSIHIYDASGTLIPDTVLPGNAAGFTNFPVSLTGISTTTYPSLVLGADLNQGTASTSPALNLWSLSYSEGPTPLPNVSFTLSGTKTIGTKGDGTPILKTILSTATGADGTQGVTLEWDSYSLSVPNYDIIDACPSPSYALAPGGSTTATLILGPPSTNSLRVLVEDATGAVVGGATVTLARTGYSATSQSSSCGSSYFGTLTSATDYSVTITKSGYTTTTFPNISVSGASTLIASFP